MENSYLIVLLAMISTDMCIVGAINNRASLTDKFKWKHNFKVELFIYNTNCSPLSLKCEKLKSSRLFT